MGYNQPPHASYFLGELEGITVAPPPLTMTGRVEVANGGTIGKAHDSQHVIVCDYADTKITVSEGATPYMVTFNVPSWVQGTNSTSTNGNGKINYTYYTCTVEGAAFTGDMRLVKQGDGTLSLPKTNNTYTGETNIWAGTVNFDGTLLQSPVWLNRFAELNSDGGQFKSIRMEYDSRLRPGHADNKGTISTGSLSLGIGARVVFDIYSDFSADQLNTSQLTVETKSWKYGPQYMAPVFEFVWHGNGDPAEGRYLIGEVGSVTGPLDKILVKGISTKLKATLLLEEGKLYLVIEGMRESGSVIWTGSASSVWDLANTENFTNSNDETGGRDLFVTGDDVWFTDNASKFTVTLNGELEAGTVYVDNNSKAYTFQGTGQLVGKTALVKQGKGTLTINTENTYSGGNRIAGGAVIVSSLANANQAKGNLGVVTTNSNLFVIENGGELRTTAAVTNGSAIQFASEEGGVINNTADFIVDRAMTGTVMTKKGNGWMKLNTSNSSLKRMIIAAGTVQCINANQAAQTVEYQGGELRENTSSSYPVYVPNGKSGKWYLANSSTYTNKVTGEGTLTVYCTTIKGTDWYATRTPIECNFSNFEGTLVPTSSQDDPAVLRFTLNTSTGMPKGTMNIGEKVQVQNSGKTYRIGKVTGTGALGGSCNFSQTGNPGANTWQVGNDDNWSTNVRVTANANLTKVGTGKVTWAAANDNSGSTNVNEGELGVNNKTLLGTGKLTVSQGATLSGYNTTSNALKNSSFVVDGRLRPGLFTLNSMFIDSKPVTINEGGVLEFNVAECATETSNGGTSLEGVSTLTVNGTIRIVPSETNTLQVGDSVRIFSVKTFVGTPKFEMQNGITWDTSRIAEGLLFVKSINTAIESIVSEHQPANIYDLRGRLIRLNAVSTEGLAPGVYISRGRKFVIK